MGQGFFGTTKRFDLTQDSTDRSFDLCCSQKAWLESLSDSTPLHRLCFFEPERAFQLLQREELEVDPNALDSKQRTPFHYLALSVRKELRLPDELVRRGANLELLDEEGWSPIDYAFHSRNFSLIPFFIRQKIDLTPYVLKVDPDLWQLFFRVIRRYDAEVLGRAFVEAFYRKDSRLAKALSLGAVRTQAFEELMEKEGEEALESYLSTEVKLKDSFHQACQMGTLTDVKGWVAKGASVYELDEEGFCPLHLASRGGNVKVVEYLLEEGCKGRKAPDGLYPIHAACLERHFEVVQLLVSYQPRHKNRLTESGFTCLHLAYLKRDEEMLYFLLGLDFSFERRAPWGPSVLGLACFQGDLSWVRTLYHRGADIKRRDGQGLTPLMQACRGDHKEVVEFLIEMEKQERADLYDGKWWEVESYSGPSLVSRVLKEPQEIRVRKTLETIEKQKVEAEKTEFPWKAQEGSSLELEPFVNPLRLCCREGCLESLKLLVEKSKDATGWGEFVRVEQDQHDWINALRVATRYGQTQVVRYLLEQRVGKSRLGGIKLCRAIGEKRMELAKLLLENGVEFGLSDYSSYGPPLREDGSLPSGTIIIRKYHSGPYLVTPLELAEACGEHELARQIKEHQAM